LAEDDNPEKLKRTHARRASRAIASAPVTTDRLVTQNIEAAKNRLHPNVLAIALADKLARIAWAVLNKERNFECARTNAMASQLQLAYGSRFCRSQSLPGHDVARFSPSTLRSTAPLSESGL
jgi:hypothetical protein